MKSAVIYYSYSGNTKMVAGILMGYLRALGSVEAIELKPLDESDNFLMQCRRAFKKTRAKIAAVNFDLSGYDLICLGTPVWAFGPAPAMNTYLDACQGLNGKAAVVFTTFGSGMGSKHCSDYMEKILSDKGVKDCRQLLIQQNQVKDRELVLGKIKEILRLWPNG